MPNRRPSNSNQDDPANHPIAWFCALLRAVDRNDETLIDEALERLEKLGYFVVPYPPRDGGTKGVA
jgi:hypothetical protein